ncbi:MAG: outer membrane protein assembly factor BamD [Gammaproteobacteria bacterium WSBS_2016_MAG_OTU1]
MKKFIQLIFFILSVAAAGCATAPEEPPTDQELYDEAKSLQARADYDLAFDKYDELIATYPASLYTQQGMLDVAYLHYQRADYASALDAADRFMQAYPDNDSVAYALYLQGLTHFLEDQNLIDRVGFQDPTERNPESMRQAFFTFKQLAEQYPESKYAEDAVNRMRYLINALSRSEIHIANYYLRRGAPIAAVGRAKQVLDIYRDSTSTEDALTVLVLAYQMMGEEENLQKVYQLLELNFPQSPLLPQNENTDN